MKKVLLFTVLLLTLAAVLTTPVAAGRPGGPGHGVERPVAFSGDIQGGSATMTVETKKKSVAVYGNRYLTFSEAFSDPSGEYDFAGHQYGHSMRITLKGGETEEVCMGSHFDWYDWEDQHGDVHRVPHYWFEGSGTYETADGTYVVTLKNVAIYEVEPKRKGKGAMEWQFVGPVWTSDSITFDMTIE